MFLAMMLWGLTWPASKIMMEAGVSPFQIACLKCGIVFLSFIPVIIYLKIPFCIPKQSLIPIFLIGIFNTIYNYLLLIGLPHGDAGSAGVIAEALSPLFATVIYTFIKQSTLLKKEKIGLFLGLIAAAFLVDIAHPNTLFSFFNIIYVFAALLWAALTISSKYATQSSHPIIVNFYSSIFPFVLFLPFLFTQELAPLKNTGLSFWIAMFNVTILSTTFATTIFYRGIKVLGVMQGGIFILLVPIGALIFSWILLGETPKIHTLIGGSIALGAIYLINFYQSKPKYNSSG
ncbi:DMT family transporter [Helicobacter sp. 11S03491-1]|uniref:DMT family transporter n=1 Tax=Helicobacter sp. 11S03491-1 TaxID=1476196 RepID=UPI000BA7E48D|nr:DMT family transporter [Helicobacter sp. 11S03491-1]